ncbi:unnamed protein product, partial [Meganyctiphanes norvegica]
MTPRDSSTLYLPNLVLGLTSRDTADLTKKSDDVVMTWLLKNSENMLRACTIYREPGSSLQNAIQLYAMFFLIKNENGSRSTIGSLRVVVTHSKPQNKNLKLLPQGEEKHQGNKSSLIKQLKLLKNLSIRIGEKNPLLRKTISSQSSPKLIKNKDEMNCNIISNIMRVNYIFELAFHKLRSAVSWEVSPRTRYDEIGDILYPTASLTFHDTGPSAPSDDDDLSPVLPSQILSPSVPSRELKPSYPGIPSVDRSSKPMGLLSAHTSGKSSGLRSVMVPTELMGKFLALAQPNTSRNVETCGILAGKLSQNRLLITHLLVPKQSGTSDSCTTHEEEQLFDYQDRLDLITLGWIHTHPGFQAFLSSVDLHTHCSYQLMMPEAIAIVCAPKYDETGYFTLTPNHGLQYIANCRQAGFHPHPKEPPLFQNADHVTMDRNEIVTVIDLRNK